jgi:hypothetical protein
VWNLQWIFFLIRGSLNTNTSCEQKRSFQTFVTCVVYGVWNTDISTSMAHLIHWCRSDQHQSWSSWAVHNCDLPPTDSNKSKWCVFLRKKLCKAVGSLEISMCSVTRKFDISFIYTSKKIVFILKKIKGYHCYNAMSLLKPSTCIRLKGWFVLIEELPKMSLLKIQ